MKSVSPPRVRQCFTHGLLLLCVAATAITRPAFAADALTEQLQRGLFEEEANRNLEAAIKEYQAVVTQSDDQRKVIATALFRLGECYRKLGRTNDASAQYQRILRDFAEQEPLAKLSREMMPPMVATTGMVGLRLVENLLAQLRAQFAEQQSRYDTLKSLSREQLLQAMPRMFNDPGLAELQSQAAAAEQRLVNLTSGPLGAGHPDVVQIGEVSKVIQKQIGERLAGILMGLKLQSDGTASQIKSLEEELEKARRGTTSAAGGRQAAAMSPTVEKLLREEISLAEQAVQTAERKMSAGKGTLYELLEAKKDVLRLKRQLPGNMPPVQQGALLEEQLGILNQLLAEFEKRIQVGVLPPGDQVLIQRELLSLQRELAVLKDVAKSFGETNSQTKP